MSLIGIIGTAAGVVLVVILLLFFILVFVAILKQIKVMNQNLVRMAERLDLRTKQDQVLMRYLEHYELQLSKWYNYTTGLQWEFGDAIMRPPNSPRFVEDRITPIDDDLLRKREDMNIVQPSPQTLHRRMTRAATRRKEL